MLVLGVPGGPWGRPRGSQKKISGNVLKYQPGKAEIDKTKARFEFSVKNLM